MHPFPTHCHLGVAWGSLTSSLILQPYLSTPFSLFFLLLLLLLSPPVSSPYFSLSFSLSLFPHVPSILERDEHPGLVLDDGAPKTRVSLLGTRTCTLLDRSCARFWGADGRMQGFSRSVVSQARSSDTGACCLCPDCTGYRRTPPCR
ncbi:hypothetical protein LZ30DRAFT_456931 [Colletotrichum cereale]|nr:hypothetical protein LZ30DRAFT_456931 [Colletotrichum cereale]